MNEMIRWICRGIIQSSIRQSQKQDNEKLIELLEFTSGPLLASKNDAEVLCSLLESPLRATIEPSSYDELYYVLIHDHLDEIWRL